MSIHSYTLEEKNFIREYSYGHSYKEITNAINDRFCTELSVNQIRAYLKNHKIKTGHDGRFVSGHESWNKGTHLGGWKPTQFKKGNMPVNHKPVGTESVRSNYKRKWKQLYIKVAEPNIWRLKKQVVWEEHYGKVPQGYVIIHKDLNELNCDISNLTIVSRHAHLIMNRMNLRTTAPELIDASVAVANISIKIGELNKKK